MKMFIYRLKREQWLRGRPLVCHAVFGPILTPLPLSHFVTHLGTPSKYVTHLGPPIFSSTCIHTYVFTGGFVLVHGVFVRGVCLEGFVWGGFCPSSLLSEYICYNRKPNITFNFRFYTHEIFFNSDVTCSWSPSPVTLSWHPSSV